MVNMVHVCPCYVRFLCNIKCNIKCITCFTWLESNPGPFGGQLWRHTDFSGSEYDFARAPPEVSTDVTDYDDEVPLLHLHKTKDSKYRNEKIFAELLSEKTPGRLDGYLEEEWVAEVDASNLQPGARSET